jgi:hypothetical protein
MGRRNVVGLTDTEQGALVEAAAFEGRAAFRTPGANAGVRGPDLVSGGGRSGPLMTLAGGERAGFGQLLRGQPG